LLAHFLPFFALSAKALPIIQYNNVAKGRMRVVLIPVAIFKVPDWGIQLTSASGCRPPFARIDFIPPVRDYEFGYRTAEKIILPD
jgi:hypothetical protein